MTVKQLFEKEKIELEFINDHFEGDYWNNCADFVDDNWNNEIDNLSIKQGTWLTKILDDCVEKRIEG